MFKFSESAKVLGVAWLVLLAACGQKGGLVPPESVASLPGPKVDDVVKSAPLLVDSAPAVAAEIHGSLQLSRR